MTAYIPAVALASSPKMSLVPPRRPPAVALDVMPNPLPPGFTLRDLFAAFASSGLAAAGRVDPISVAHDSYDIADAMLARREYGRAH